MRERKQNKHNNNLKIQFLFNKAFHPNAASVIPARYWMPKWSGNATDPSARTLRVYDQTQS